MISIIERCSSVSPFAPGRDAIRSRVPWSLRLRLSLRLHPTKHALGKCAHELIRVSVEDAAPSADAARKTVGIQATAAQGKNQADPVRRRCGLVESYVYGRKRIASSEDAGALCNCTIFRERHIRQINDNSSIDVYVTK